MPDCPTISLAYVFHLPRAVALSALSRVIAGMALSTLLLGGAAALAARVLPSDAQFAEEAEFSYPYVRANKQTLRLAVGVRIYNEHNLIVMPATVPPTANVLFKTDINGDVSRVWILTDDEAKAYQDK
jgi:hypothetical protein